MGDGYLFPGKMNQTLITMKSLYFFLFLNFIFFSISAQTWEWSNPKPCGNVMEGIYFTDPSTGYIVGTGGIIMKTYDGGDSWNILNSGTLYDLYDLSFPNANTGYAVVQMESF